MKKVLYIPWDSNFDIVLIFLNFWPFVTTGILHYMKIELCSNILGGMRAGFYSLLLLNRRIDIFLIFKQNIMLWF